VASPAPPLRQPRTYQPSSLDSSIGWIAEREGTDYLRDDTESSIFETPDKPQPPKTHPSPRPSPLPPSCFEGGTGTHRVDSPGARSTSTPTTHHHTPNPLTPRSAPPRAGGGGRVPLLREFFVRDLNSPSHTPRSPRTPRAPPPTPRQAAAEQQRGERAGVFAPRTPRGLTNLSQALDLLFGHEGLLAVTPRGRSPRKSSGGGGASELAFRQGQGQESGGPAGRGREAHIQHTHTHTTHTHTHTPRPGSFQSVGVDSKVYGENAFSWQASPLSSARATDGGARERAARAAQELVCGDFVTL